MKKPDPTEEALSALRQLERAGNHPAFAEVLPAFLRNRSPAVIARAAHLTVSLALTPNLIEAFRKILPDPIKRDPGCRALTAIAAALAAMEAPAAEIFAIGIRHQQWEGSFGLPIDTAAGLRAISALGASGKPEAELLLRFKAALGDEKSDITSECFLNLLHLTPRTAVPYVAAFLESPNEETAEAALWDLALSRHEAAIACLLAKLESAKSRHATQILEALALYKTDETRRTQVRHILDVRGDTQLEKLFAAHWNTQS